MVITHSQPSYLKENPLNMHKSTQTALTLLSLALSSSAFADSDDTTAPVKTFTSPAQIQLTHPWSTHITASFLYWQAFEDNTELGIVSTSSSAPSGSVIDNHNEFKPGFQVAVGFNTNYDGWDTELQYTWYHGREHNTKSIDEDSTDVILPFWLSPITSTTFKSASNTWKLEMNLVDWVLGRSCALGDYLSARPFFGLRAAFIDQHASADYVHTATPVSWLYKGHSKSWAIGPELGCQSEWSLGSGFRFYGNVEADILYTEYTHLSAEEYRATTGAPSQRRNVDQHNLSTIRPHSDLQIGLKWGSYLGHNCCHLDLTLGYGFQVFWHQNMFRKFIDDTARGASFSPNGNLYIQGLTASVRFDF